MYRQEELEQAMEQLLYEPTVKSIQSLKARVDEMLAYTKAMTEMSQRLLAVMEYHELCDTCGRHYSDHEAGEEGVCEFILEDVMRQTEVV